ncbi:protein FAR1-RELATED SEQUENCE 5-like [Chenopodium quinoa]|uniref:protein FAR1-RELATED SEQUENCE 5-like n=1 Tax=Chenopodium quinoa TaxID=63459 RepID=UPI000B78A1E9|nr:protein FAR1-RELATED SEQUENCE 5-like [Chenopodium quinoa]
MDDNNNRTPEASSEDSDLESEDGGDGVNYSVNFVTDTLFPTFDNAIKWADAVSINLGFILVKSSYNKTRDDSWKIRAKNDESGTHNHPMIVYQEGHRKISGLSPDAKNVVHDMTKSKVAPHNIMATIAKQFPDDHLNITHIYNCRNDLRTEMSKGRRVVQQFLHLARQSQCIYWVMTDDLGVLQHAFMVHPITVNILRIYSHAIGMDSTYKTNRYGMPFFEIVGVTSTNQNFLVGYVFMRNECTTSYR